MKKKVAFICVHNSCRSQMAEALGMEVKFLKAIQLVLKQSHK